MIFFQDTRSIGMIFWIVAVVLAANAVMVLAAAFDFGSITIPDTVTDRRMFCLLTGIGSAAAAMIYAWNAHRTMSVRKSRLEVVRSYVMVIGLCTLIYGIFSGLAVFLYSDESVTGLAIALTTIILAAIVFAIAFVIGDGKKGPLKKVVWAILMIAFVLMALDAVMPAQDYWEFADHIAHLIIAVFMVSFIADADVRREMGVSE